MARSLTLLASMLMLALGTRAQAPNLAGYEYWFDQNDGARVFVPVAPATTVDLVNVQLSTSGLSLGQHVACLRWKDQPAAGQARWSSVVCRSLHVGQPGPWEIIAVRYWIGTPTNDSDPLIRYKFFDTPQTELDFNGPIEMCGYDPGNQILKFQLLDNHGQWSSVVTRQLNIVATTAMGIASITPSYVPYCTGQQVTFTAQPVTTNNAALPSAYSWTMPPSWDIVSASAGSIVVIIGDAPGTISVTGSNFCNENATANLDVPNVDCPDVDCLGVLGGTALPGTACNDGDPLTLTDLWSASCACEGYDCLGIANGSALPGTSCNDGLATTENDTWTSNCQCIGVPIPTDCEGVVGGPALPGTLCDDGLPTTENDTWNASCQCVGEPMQTDCEGVLGGPALPGTPCNNGSPGTWNLSCECVQSGGEYYAYEPSVTSCSGAFLDSGGNGGPYGNNESFTTVICPDGAGPALSLQWIIFNLSTAGTAPLDQLSIYDGTSTSDPLIGTWSGNDNPGINSTSFGNITGCLTVVFTSNNVGTGEFAAAITCFQPCEQPTADANVGGQMVPLLVCQGEDLIFDGTGSYAAGGFTVQQWIWDFADGTIDSTSGPIISHSFSDPAEYIVQVTVIDDNECASTNLVDLHVLVSTTPSFAGTTQSQTLCLGDSLTLVASVNAVAWSSGVTASYDQGMLIPDLQGVPFNASVDVTSFAPGQLVSSVNEIGSVCVNMEHSYMGDLVIQLACPNGQSIVLHQQGGGGTYLGIPVDDESDTPGTCWSYCWSPTATNGTWVDNSGGTLASGTYEGMEPFDNLLGCPLNGTWTFTITDLFAIDNGYECGWSINFADGTSYIPTLGIDPDSCGWSGNGLISDPVDPLLAIATPTQAGSFDYVFSVTDNFGCTYDTTITLFVPDLVIDTINGPTSIPLGGEGTYTTSPVLPDAESIVWTLPPGWSWSLSDTDTLNAVAILDPPDAPGSYSICAQAFGGGCDGVPFCLEVGTVGVNEFTGGRLDLLVFPNPSNGQLTIRVASGTGSLHLQVRDALGRVVLVLNDHTGDLNLSMLPSGTYELSWVSASGQGSTPIVIMR